MTEITVGVEGMMCGHCRGARKRYGESRIPVREEGNLFPQQGTDRDPHRGGYPGGQAARNH